MWSRVKRSLAAMTTVAVSWPDTALCVCVYMCDAELECRPPCEAGPRTVGQVQRAGH